MASPVPAVMPHAAPHVAIEVSESSDSETSTPRGSPGEGAPDVNAVHRSFEAQRYASCEMHGMYMGGDVQRIGEEDLLQPTATLAREPVIQDASDRHSGTFRNYHAPDGDYAERGDLKDGEEASRQRHDSTRASLLFPIAPSQQLTLTFLHMNGYAPTALMKPSLPTQLAQKIKRKRRTAQGKDAAKPAFRQVLFDLCGIVRPNEVLALMGPSGSGKTTLLSFIGGRAPKQMKMDGQVLVNGQPMTKKMRRRIGYVLQDDVLYEQLTVEETLTYAARLRLPRTMTPEEKKARVDAVIQVLGLDKSRNTIIGGYFRRGISGGERKRVSIGHELLINPAILMLDEPTSGLDSTTALHLLTILRDLASGGRAILTTIHQPSSRLYRKLDQLMLLAEGHLMYFGGAHKVLDWFGHYGLRIPLGVNVADFILDLATGEVDADEGGPADLKIVKQLYTSFEMFHKMHPLGFHDTKVLANWPRDLAQAAALPPLDKDLRDIVLSRAALGNGAKQMQQEQQQRDVHGHRSDQQAGVLPRSMPAEGAATAGGAANDATANHVGDVEMGVVPYSPGSNVSVPAAATRRRGLLPAAAGIFSFKRSGASDATAAASGVRDDRAAASAFATAEPATTSTTSVEGGVEKGATYWEQIRVLTTRATKVRRFESLTGQNMFQLLAVAFITGLLWWQRGQTNQASAISDLTGLLFFELLFPSFRALFSALFTFPNEFRMLTKERPSGMYKLSAYYAARTLADLPIEIIYPFVFTTIIYWFGGLRHTAAGYLGNLLSMMLITLVAQGFGLLVGGICMDPKTAQTVTTVVMLTFLLVGGFYVKNIPVWISWIKYLSFLYWGFSLLTKIQFSGMVFYQNGQPVANLESLGLPNNPNDSVWLEIVVLFAMLIATRVAIYFVLVRKTAGQKLA